MLVRAHYVCEICGAEHELASEALRCESIGLPCPMPFLPFGELIPAFGANGIEWAILERVYIEFSLGVFGHHWRVIAQPRPILSYNLRDDAGVPASAFDPRVGFDAFRYGCSEGDAAAWRWTMARYGFAEADASPWILDRVASFPLRRPA